MSVLVCWFAKMLRRILAVTAIVLLSGMLPLAGSTGFCASKPCCRGHARSGPALGSHPACCNETNCATPQRDSEATAAKIVALHPILLVDVFTEPVTQPVV